MLVPLQERAASAPQEHAIQTLDGAISWSDCADVVLRMASAIKAMDLGERRRVAIVARNRPSTVLAHAAAILASACNVPVNFHLTAPEIEYQIEESEALLVFADGPTLAATKEAVGDKPVTIVELPATGARGAGVDAFIEGHEPLELVADQPVLPSLLFTSGTTGRPKSVQLPPKTVGASPILSGFHELITTQRMAKYGPHLVVGPLYHNGPLTAVRLLLAGVPLVIPSRFDAAEALAAIETYGIESSVMVPTHFVRFLALPDEVRAAAKVDTLKCIVHTGGACPADVKRSMLEWWGKVLYESYGGTESGSTCSIGPEEWLAHPGSVGRAVPPFTAIVVDEQGNELPPDTEGRLYFKDSTGRGIVYEGDPEKTAEAHLAPGVFTLGEIGKIDTEGYVYITDRFSDMVVSGGVNVYPAETEQTLRQHPGVADVACFGVPDRDLGERLVAVVQPTLDATPTGDELLAWCANTLAKYKLPRTITLVEEVPRNAMGKIDKKALRSSYVPS